jgi:hypothetical protein
MPAAGWASPITASSVVAMRAGRIPGWAGWVSIAIGFLPMLSVFFFARFLVALWLLIAGFTVFRAGTPAATPAAA